MNFPNFLRAKICFLNISRVLARVSHVFINYFQSLMTSFQVLTAITTLESRGVFPEISKACDSLTRWIILYIETNWSLVEIYFN